MENKGVLAYLRGQMVRAKGCTEELDFEEALKKRKLQKKMTAGAIAVAVLVAVIAFVIWQKVRTFHGYNVSFTIEDTVGEHSSYYMLGKEHVLRINGDGITCYKGKSPVWNLGYDKQKVSMDICGTYVAVGEIGGSEIHIANSGDSTEGVVSTKYPMRKVEVAGQGVVAALTEDTAANYIEVWDKEGNQLVTGRTVLAGNGYPVDLSLSSDGKKLIVSYIHVSDGVSQSRIVFYNFSEVGKNEVDRMVGVYNNFDDMIVPMVEFLTDRYAVAVADSCLTFYEMNEKPSEITRVEIKGEIDRVEAGTDYLAVLYDKGKTLALYNKKGKCIMETELDYAIDSLRLSGNRVMTISGAVCRLYNSSGKIIFEQEFTNGMTDVIPMNRNHFLMLSNDGVQRISLK